jgi:hypothetical protein
MILPTILETQKTAVTAAAMLTIRARAAMAGSVTVGIPLECFSICRACRAVAYRATTD